MSETVTTTTSSSDGWVLSAVTNNKFLAAAILTAILGGVALGRAQAVTETKLQFTDAKIESHIQQTRDERAELNAALNEIRKDIKSLLERK